MARVDCLSILQLTFIVRIYGMNFDYIPELHHRWAYPAVWIIIGVITLYMIIFFRQTYRKVIEWQITSRLGKLKQRYWPPFTTLSALPWRAYSPYACARKWPIKQIWPSRLRKHLAFFPALNIQASSVISHNDPILYFSYCLFIFTISSIFTRAHSGK